MPIRLKLFDEKVLALFNQWSIIINNGRSSNWIKAEIPSSLNHWPVLRPWSLHQLPRGKETKWRWCQYLGEIRTLTSICNSKLGCPRIQEIEPAYGNTRGLTSPFSIHGGVSNSAHHFIWLRWRVSSELRYQNEGIRSTSSGHQLRRRQSWLRWDQASPDVRFIKRRLRSQDKGRIVRCEITLSPEMKSGGFFGRDFMEYNLKTEPLGWEVKRRFSDFEGLRSIMKRLYPHIYVSQPDTSDPTHTSEEIKGKVQGEIPQ